MAKEVELNRFHIERNGNIYGSNDLNDIYLSVSETDDDGNTTVTKYNAKEWINEHSYNITYGSEEPTTIAKVGDIYIQLITS